MPKSRIASVLVILVTGALGLLGEPLSTGLHASGSQTAEGGKTVDVTKIRVVLTADKASGPLQDVVTVQVAIRNEGPDTVYLFRRLEWGVGGGLALLITNDRGEIVPTGDFILWPPLPPDDPAMLVQLDEERFFGAWRQLSIGKVFRNRGYYTLQAYYHTPLSRHLYGDKLANLRVLSHDDPGIYSNKLAFEVVP